MNYGLYVSASGVLTNLYRQDVFANNLANVKTVGFKPDTPVIRQRQPESIEDNHPADLHKRLMDQLGGGVFAGKQRVSMTPGAMNATGNPLDLALVGANAFFSVQTTDASGAQSEMLTRDGRFVLNDQSELVMATTGHRVLDVNDNPITVEAQGDVKFDGQGNLTVNGEPVAELKIIGVNDLARLEKHGHGLFNVNGQGEYATDPDHRGTRAGHVESSGVDPITALMDVIKATKAVTANGNLIKYHDLVTDRAVNTLGRVNV